MQYILKSTELLAVTLMLNLNKETSTLCILQVVKNISSCQTLGVSVVSLWVENRVREKCQLSHLVTTTDLSRRRRGSNSNRHWLEARALTTEPTVQLKTFVLLCLPLTRRVNCFDLLFSFFLFVAFFSQITPVCTYICPLYGKKEKWTECRNVLSNAVRGCSLPRKKEEK